jgi:hypothetical protein
VSADLVDCTAYVFDADDAAVALCYNLGLWSLRLPYLVVGI